jgi:hypothetical protein
MGFNESCVFYLLLGSAVSIARQITHRHAPTSERVWDALAALAFWPLYLPIVLTQRATPETSAEVGETPCDDLTTAIDQVESELTSALASLDGWAEGVVSHKLARLEELRTALTAQAARVRDMQALVRCEQARITEPPTGEYVSNPAQQRWQRSEQARAENMQRLVAVCQQSYLDLMATLAWIRELVSMIHLAKFTGAPVARAEELVAQIAAAIESISSLSGHTSAEN